jgi:VIT1/CCC1 family predicted Fe2+/Mn2+ transporter
MPFRQVFGVANFSPHQSEDKPTTLPLYSPIVASEASTAEHSARSSELDEIGNDQLYPAHRHSGMAGSDADSSTYFSCPRLPTMSRFLADFTLGFADGLTVPFALTAGLSSLGQTDTVVYAGAAEICAGSISMGIGGYLSAKGERAAEVDVEKRRRDNETAGEEGAFEDDEQSQVDVEKLGMMPSASSEVAADYLKLLDLPSELLEAVLAHVRERPGVMESLKEKANGEDDDGARSCSPVLVGFSVSLGYLVGGLLPLFPYFFVDQVADGLVWSFGVCLVALFIFGFTKDFFLHRQLQMEGTKLLLEKGGGVRLKDIGRSAWEGLQMVILGGLAALAAILCVRFFEGLRVTPGDVPA